MIEDCPPNNFVPPTADRSATDGGGGEGGGGLIAAELRRMQQQRGGRTEDDEGAHGAGDALLRLLQWQTQDRDAFSSQPPPPPLFGPALAWGPVGFGPPPLRVPMMGGLPGYAPPQALAHHQPYPTGYHMNMGHVNMGMGMPMGMGMAMGGMGPFHGYQGGLHANGISAAPTSDTPRSRIVSDAAGDSRPSSPNPKSEYDRRLDGRGGAESPASAPASGMAGAPPGLVPLNPHGVFDAHSAALTNNVVPANPQFRNPAMPAAAAPHRAAMSAMSAPMPWPMAMGTGPVGPTMTNNRVPTMATSNPTAATRPAANPPAAAFPPEASSDPSSDPSSTSAILSPADFRADPTSSAFPSPGASAAVASREDPAWDERYDALRRFAAKHGHCNVPARHGDDPRLGRWVMTQRRQFALLMQGLPSALGPDRIRKLEAVGFSWSVRPEPAGAWSEKFRELKDYKAKFGNAMVPQRYKANPQLGTWVHTQRRQHKLLAEGKRSSMTDEKRKLLDSVGFEWYAAHASAGSAAAAAAREGQRKATEKAKAAKEEEEAEGKDAAKEDESQVAGEDGSSR